MKSYTSSEISWSQSRNFLGLSFGSLPQETHRPPGSKMSILVTCSKLYDNPISKMSKNDLQESKDTGRMQMASCTCRAFCRLNHREPLSMLHLKSVF